MCNRFVVRTNRHCITTIGGCWLNRDFWKISNTGQLSELCARYSNVKNIRGQIIHNYENHKSKYQNTFWGHRYNVNTLPSPPVSFVKRLTYIDFLTINDDGSIDYSSLSLSLRWSDNVLGRWLINEIKCIVWLSIPSFVSGWLWFSCMQQLIRKRNYLWYSYSIITTVFIVCCYWFICP